MSVTSAKDRARQNWDRQAAGYDKRIAFWERHLFAGDRQWACGQARGDVLEVAVGTGRNLEHYPADARITGVDVSPEMLRHARRRAAEVRRGARLCEADAESLPFGDETFDTVVCTYSLCSIPDDRKAVSEMARVLRRGGRLVLVDHVASPRPLVAATQWLLHQLTYRLASEHLLRNPRLAVGKAGLAPVLLERRKAGIVDRVVATKGPITASPRGDARTQ